NDVSRGCWGRQPREDDLGDEHSPMSVAGNHVALEGVIGGSVLSRGSQEDVRRVVQLDAVIIRDRDGSGHVRAHQVPGFDTTVYVEVLNRVVEVARDEIPLASVFGTVN